MENKINFIKYRYIYFNGIVRMDRKTKKCERFIHGKFVETKIRSNIEDLLREGFSDVFELDEGTSRELAFLKSELYPHG